MIDTARNSNTCKICEAPRGRSFRAKEMMFGLGDEFEYFECAACGCVQLLAPPSELARYYPANYYAFAEPEALPRPPAGRLAQWLYRARNAAEILNTGCLGQIVARVRPRPDMRSLRPLFVESVRIKLSMSIVDVGCGQGNLLRQLASAGFTSLIGVDPFLPGGNRRLGPIEFVASSLDALRGRKIDLLMFHHSLEHMPDQTHTLQLAGQLLSEHGVCLIRIPVASSEVWREYQTNWVELDPPRHFFLHTIESMRRLAESAGMSIVRVVHDTTGFAYWGSELYRRGLPLHELGNPRGRDPASVFSADELEMYEARARVANMRRDGGRAAFYLRRKR